MDKTPKLFTPLEAGALHLRNRVVVAPLTRNRALPGGAAPVGPSALRAETRTFDGKKFTPVSQPRALALDEIPGVIADYARAARDAREAGFDGIEPQRTTFYGGDAHDYTDYPTLAEVDA